MSRTIVLFGDSITQFSFDTNLHGWGASLANHYQRQADVVNRGFSGYNTKWALEIMPQIFESSNSFPHLKLLTIFFGANDAADPKINVRQPVPVEKYAQNLKDMIIYIRKIYSEQSQPHIVLITPPAMDEDAYLMTFRARTENPNAPIPDRRSELVEPYVEAVISVAKEMQVPYLDLYHQMRTNPEYKKYVVDGLHLSSEGNQFVFNSLVQLINTTFPELNPQKGMVMDFIDNKLIDLENPKESLKRRNY